VGYGEGRGLKAGSPREGAFQVVIAADCRVLIVDAEAGLYDDEVVGLDMPYRPICVYDGHMPRLGASPHRQAPLLDVPPHLFLVVDVNSSGRVFTCPIGILRRVVTFWWAAPLRALVGIEGFPADLCDVVAPGTLVYRRRAAYPRTVSPLVYRVDMRV